jgi:hypothetical protein
MAGCLAVAGMIYADGVTPVLIPSGYASFGLGEINGESDQPEGASYLEGFPSPQLDHVLMQRMFVGYNLETKFNPLPIQTNLGLEMEVYNETPRSGGSDNGIYERLFYFPYLTRADFNYSAGKGFNLDFGYFPFKYNPDSRNLGEYLFRTGTYPQYIQTNFDFPMARLTGLLLNGTAFDGFNWDALLTMNTQWVTMGDLNLTGIFSYQPIKLFEIGGGVSFCSIISANSEHTQPTVHGFDSELVIGAQGDDEYLSGKDTLTYTFAGTKLMGRISIDPKQLLPDDIKSFFGENDCKLYSEAAILGVKDYPISINGVTDYSNVLRRIPIMFGFNFPTWKILDVLSIEGEYFGSTYPDDMSALDVTGVPTPVNEGSGGTATNGIINYVDSTRNHWKWSVYGKKTIAGHFSIVAQVAKDHYRWEFNDYQSQATMGMLAALTKPGDFYYIAKVGYDF